MELPVLILNSSEEVLGLVSWKRAISLIYKNKVSAPHNFHDTYKIRTVNGHYELPSVLILNTHVRLPYRVASLTRNNIFKRDRYTCQYCGRKLQKSEETIDHVHPRSKGGRHEWKNLVTACKPCNSSKSHKSLHESGLKLLKQPTVPTKNMLMFFCMENNRESWNRWKTE